MQVGEIPAFFLGNQGFDERELRALRLQDVERGGPLHPDS